MTKVRTQPPGPGKYINNSGLARQIRATDMDCCSAADPSLQSTVHLGSYVARSLPMLVRQDSPPSAHLAVVWLEDIMIANHNLSKVENTVCP